MPANSNLINMFSIISGRFDFPRIGCGTLNDIPDFDKMNSITYVT